jgi:hypothetical protein
VQERWENTMKDRRNQAGKESTASTTRTERSPYQVVASDTLLDLMQRDLDAWIVAKAAIAKAMGA